MKAGSYRYTCEGDEYRVVIVGDVIALPGENWSGENYGRQISEEWLLHSGRLPGRSMRRKRILAHVIRCALAEHHGYELPEVSRG